MRVAELKKLRKDRLIEEIILSREEFENEEKRMEERNEEKKIKLKLMSKEIFEDARMFAIEMYLFKHGESATWNITNNFSLKYPEAIKILLLMKKKGILNLREKIRRDGHHSRYWSVKRELSDLFYRIDKKLEEMKKEIK
jgi:hypothetical protein